MTAPEGDAVRIGVLGTGAISQVVHLPILTDRDDVRVASVSDADPHKARSIADRFGVERVLEEREIVEDPELDALVISTPNHRHQEQAIAALDAGKHVLVERPLAFTGRGVEEVLAAAEGAGRAVAVGVSHRYRPDVGALRSFVAGGELGEIFAVRGAWLNRKIPLARVTWRQQLEKAGGGALMDLGTQALDLCLWLVDYPDVERVMAVTRKGEHEVEEAASVMLVAEGGITFQVEVTSAYYGDEDRHYLRVMGSEGSGSLPPLQVQKQLGGRPMDVTPERPAARSRENPYTSAYRRQLDHFVRIVSGEAAPPLPREQVKLMTLIEAAYRSAGQGTEVEL